MNLYLERLVRALTLAELVGLAERLPSEEQDSLGRAWAQAMTATIGRERLHELLARLVFGDAPPPPPPSAPSAPPPSAPSAPPPSAPASAPSAEQPKRRRGRPPKVRDPGDPPPRRGRPPKMRTEAAQVPHEPESLALFEPGTEPELDGSEPEPLDRSELEPEPEHIGLEDERAGLLMLRQAIAAYDYAAEDPQDLDKVSAALEVGARSIWMIKEDEHNAAATAWLKARGIVEEHHVNQRRQAPLGGTVAVTVAALSPLAELAYVRGQLQQGAEERAHAGLVLRVGSFGDEAIMEQDGELLRSIDLARRDCLRAGREFPGIEVGELLRDRPFWREPLAELLAAGALVLDDSRVRLAERPFWGVRRESATAWRLTSEILARILEQERGKERPALIRQFDLELVEKLASWGLIGRASWFDSDSPYNCAKRWSRDMSTLLGGHRWALASRVALRVEARTRGRAFVVDHPARPSEYNEILTEAVRAGLVPHADALMCAVGSASSQARALVSSWIERAQDHAIAWQASPVSAPPVYIEGAIVRALGEEGAIAGGSGMVTIAKLARSTAYSQRAIEAACRLLEQKGLLVLSSELDHGAPVVLVRLSQQDALEIDPSERSGEPDSMDEGSDEA